MVRARIGQPPDSAKQWPMLPAAVCILSDQGPVAKSCFALSFKSHSIALLCTLRTPHAPPGVRHTSTAPDTANEHTLQRGGRSLDCAGLYARKPHRTVSLNFAFGEACHLYTSQLSPIRHSLLDHYAACPAKRPHTTPHFAAARFRRAFWTGVGVPVQLVTSSHGRMGGRGQCNCNAAIQCALQQR